jgi:hypothetical protein
VTPWGQKKGRQKKDRKRTEKGQKKDRKRGQTEKGDRKRGQDSFQAVAPVTV